MKKRFKQILEDGAACVSWWKCERAGEVYVCGGGHAGKWSFVCCALLLRTCFLETRVKQMYYKTNKERKKCGGGEEKEILFCCVGLVVVAACVPFCVYIDAGTAPTPITPPDGRAKGGFPICSPTFLPFLVFLFDACVIVR